MSDCSITLGLLSWDTHTAHHQAGMGLFFDLCFTSNGCCIMQTTQGMNERLHYRDTAVWNCRGETEDNSSWDTTTPYIHTYSKGSNVTSQHIESLKGDK